MPENQVWSLGWGGPLEKGMAIHSSILVWGIPWTKETSRLLSMGSQRVRHNWATNISPRNINKSFPKIRVCSFLSRGAAFSKKITDIPGCGEKKKKTSILVTNFCQVTNKFIFLLLFIINEIVRTRIFVVKNYWQQIETISMRILFLWKDHRIAVAAEKRVGSWGDFCLSSKKGAILVYLYANHTCQVGRKKSVI